MPDIKDLIKGSKSIKTVVIEQTLNKLFYATPRPNAEAKLVRNVLLKDDAGKERVGLHASSIIASEKEFCIREQVLSLFYKQAQGENIPVGLKRIFEEGNAIHEKWQRLFVRGKLGKVNDMDRTRLIKKYDLSFTPDAIIKIAKERYVVEIKSMNTFSFKKAQSHPSGEKQLQLYMYLTGIYNGFVLCDDKNTQDFKAFVKEYDSGIVAPYVERLEAIQYYKQKLLNERKMVKRICPNSNCKRALKCNMRNACFNVGKGRALRLSGRNLAPLKLILVTFRSLLSPAILMPVFV